MIPDVLFEARTAITLYLERFPTLYAPHQAEIEALCARMAEVQRTLETPFFGMDDAPEEESL